MKRNNNKDDFHKRYIKSKEFDEVRKAVFERDNCQCVICGRTENLVCHHKCYKHLGEGNQAEIDDCVTLCNLDHISHHKQLYNYRWYSNEHPRNVDSKTIVVNGKELIITNNGDVYDINYKKVKVYKNRKRSNYNYLTINNKSYVLHRLVAQTFPEICGEWFEGCEIHHIDCDNQNNRPDNLMVVSNSVHNMFHRDDKIKRAKEINSRPVMQFSLSGEYIQTFNSISEASERTSISRTGIENVLNGWSLTSGDYQWSYDGKNIKPIKTMSERLVDKASIAISQYTIDGIWIADYKNQNDAFEALNRKKSGAINNCLRGRSKTAFGYIWKYKNKPK